MESLKLKMEEVQRRIFMKDKSALTLLKKLGGEMLAVSDHVQNGRFFYLKALADYHFELFDKFYEHLLIAVRHLLRSSDHRLLARTYNLFAANAQRAGLYDVALNYYLLAHSFVERDENALERVMIEANRCDLLADMGEYQRAALYAGRCIPLMENYKDNPSYTEYTITFTINQGIYSLYAGHTEKARRLLKQTEKSLKAAPVDVVESIAPWLLMLKAQIVFAERDTENMGPFLNDVIARIVNSPQFSLLTNDVIRFCKAMLAAGELDSAKRLISAIEKTQDTGSSAYAQMRIVQLRINHYKSLGRRRKLMEAYAVRQKLTRMAEDERRTVYHESVKLMAVADELLQEQAMRREENIRLQTQAEQDILTGLPNRFALNRVIEQKFDSAKQKRESFGVGIIDIDSFKNYNDCFGHQKGDVCLAEVASVLRGVSEKYDVPCFRYGGDEFVLIYGNMNNNSILRLEREVMEASPVSISHGYYRDRVREDTKVWEFLSFADARLYLKKQNNG